MTGPRREITAAELALMALGAALVPVVMHWPLVLELGDRIPKDLGDPLVQAWQVAWGGHALANQPLEFFQSNQFWPLRDTLAFSDALLGYAPAGLIGSGPHDAVVRYDLLFLFAYALAFAAAYLLARELGAGPGGAAVAGAAFAFAPFRLEQDGHLHVISSGGIPLALALGVRGYRLRRPWPVLGGFAVATWQLSLGFSLGLPFLYLLAAIGLVAAVVWLRRGRPRLDRRLAAATAVGAALLAGSAALISQPYFRVADEHPVAVRSPELVDRYSGPAYTFLVAPDENLVWGGATAGLREGLEFIPEKTLFPGLAIVVLAICGMWSASYPRRTRAALAAGVATFTVLALGFEEGRGLLYPYRILYELFPGWEGIRTPGRLVTFSSLGLALLAAAGAELLIRGASSRLEAGQTQLAPALAGLLVLVVLVEGRGLPFDPFDHQDQPRPPAPPAEMASIAAPQLHLPADRPEDNRRYVLWSTDGFPDMVNGRSSTNPTFTKDVIRRARRFPDRRSIGFLRELGVRSVVVHPGRTSRAIWQPPGKPPPPGAGVSRREAGEVIVYEIRSPSAGAPAVPAAARSARRSR